MSISELPRSTLSTNRGAYFPTALGSSGTDPLVGIPRLMGRLYARQHLTSAIADDEEVSGA